MKNIFQKSAMAIAVASLSVSAFAAGELINGSDPTVVLANEVFGAGSESTLIAAPLTVYTVDVTKNAIDVGETATVKFTMNKTAVFGENLSLIDNWAASNATLDFVIDGVAVPVGGEGAPFAQPADLIIEIDAGGEIGENTVTFKITNDGAAAVELDEVHIGQYRVRNLTSPLNRESNDPTVRLGAEFRNNDTGDTDTAPSRIIFSSQNGVALDGSVTSYETSGLRARIDVANLEKNFTGELGSNTGENAAQDFDEGDNVDYVNLGSLAVVRTEVGAGPDLVKKENGEEFDFNSDDNITITLTSSANFDAFSSVYLRNVADGACDDDATGAHTATWTSGSNEAVISLSGETTDELSDGYNVCAVAKGDVAIPEQKIDATLNVTYFNPRYTDSTDDLAYNWILRNGCSVTLFNLPTTGVGDDAYIRLTNVSEKPGAVRGFVWTEDGEQKDIGSELIDSLAAHATVVLHTNEGQGNGVFLGDVLEDYSALTSGRHRIVLQGAFPACEAMGLIRTPAGVLVNMTSTTYSGDASRLGEFTNGTSNTTN
jgi:hypothetical protein